MFRKKLATILLGAVLSLNISAFSMELVSAANSTGWRLSGTNWKYSINGSDIKGWLLYNNKWYYFDVNATMAKGWIQYNGKWYFLNDTGDMQIGWLLQSGKWYYLNQDGSRADNSWISYNNKWYYLGGSGEMAVNTTTPDGYIVGADGAWTGRSVIVTNAPENLTAAVASSSAINLQWTKSQDVDYYYVYYSLDNKTFNPIVLSDSSKQKFQWALYYSAQITDLAPGTKLYFKITAVKRGVESDYSSVVSATTNTGTIPPPADIQSKSLISTSLDLTWRAIIGADYYNVYYRKSSSTDYTKIKSTKNSFTLPGLTADTSYYIKITTVKGTAESTYSLVVAARTPSVSAPIDVKAQATGSNSIIVSWTKVSGVDSYYVYYRKSTDNYFTSIKCTANSYTLSNLDSGTKVYFMVTAVKGTAESGVIAVVDATVGNVSVASPTGVLAQTASYSSLDFNWNAVTGADYYYVYYRKSGDSDYTQVKRTTNYFVLNNLSPNTTVYFKVTAVDGVIESNYSITTYAATYSY